VRIYKDQRAVLSKRTQITLTSRTCRPEHEQPPLRHRRPDHPPPRTRSAKRIRKRIEEAFGWIKGAGLRKTRHRGTARVGWMFTLTAAADNLIRLPKLLAAA
jgi:hypothetical protein